MQSFVLTNQSKCNYLFVISHYVCLFNAIEVLHSARLTSLKCETYYNYF